MIVGFNWRYSNINLMLYIKKIKFKITWGKRTKDEMKNILIKWQRKYIERIDIMSLKKIKLLQKGIKKKKKES